MSRLMQRVCIPRRQLGHTGFIAAPLGIGDLADRAVSLEQCVATACRAIDAGFNVIDCAPSYENGYSEQIVGQAVRQSLQSYGQSFRSQLFIIDKVDFLDQPVAPQVEASLQRLGLEQTDLFVFHSVSTVSAWESLVRPGAGFDQLQTCRQAGKMRFMGISSHHPQVLERAIPSGLCDVVMFPVGAYVDSRFVQDMLPLARKHQVGTVCFKTFGGGKLVADTIGYNQPLQHRPRGKLSSGGTTGGSRGISGDSGGSGGPILPHLSPAQCLHYTLTCDPDVALLGMSFPNEQDAVFEAYRQFTGPLSDQQMEKLRKQAAEAVVDKGPCWWNPPAGE